MKMFRVICRRVDDGKDDKDDEDEYKYQFSLDGKETNLERVTAGTHITLVMCIMIYSTTAYGGSTPPCTSKTRRSSWMHCAEQTEPWEAHRPLRNIQ